MLIIDLAEEELCFFEDMKNHFPDNMIIKKDRGFNAASSVQVVIDVSAILKESLPYIVAIVEAILLYRNNKKQNELKQKELDLEKEKANKVSFEIRLSSDGDNQYLIKAEDANKALESPENIRHLLDEFQSKLKATNEKPKKKDKNKKK